MTPSSLGRGDKTFLTTGPSRALAVTYNSRWQRSGKGCGMAPWMLGDITEFSSGAALGGLLLCGGIVLGLLLGRWLAKAISPGLSSDDVLKIVTQFRNVTHGVAEDMSQYREVMDVAQQRIRDLKQNPASGDDSALQLLSQMTQANELLQRRIAEAESTLSEQSEQMAAAMSEARTDALTRLANRRAFEDEFQRRSAEFRRHGTRFLFMLIDIDRFKLLNDTYGHPSGDAVLAQLADILRKTVRDTDLVARYGGEEFVLLLPAGEMPQVSDSMERIRRAVEAAEFRLEDRTIRATVSCGAAEPLERDAAGSGPSAPPSVAEPRSRWSA
ncbi:MAG: GGDEF domain-containing protein, partial [Pirellulaceae bacterium]|nr:GGDEF domain-containing protein [Pirellulaceae bacterium]